MRVSLVIVAAATATVVCGCSSSSSPSASGPTTTPTTQSSTTPQSTSTPASSPSVPAAPVLPSGYVALSEPHIRIGVPRSWIRVAANTSAAKISRLETTNNAAKSRLVSDGAAVPAANRMFAIDPATTTQVLLLVLPTEGVTVSKSGLTHIYNTNIKPGFAGQHIAIISHTLGTIGGHNEIRLTANYERNGISVREVVDIVAAKDKIYDLTFSGGLAAIKKVESTVFFS
jgi:hypothetical protein